MKTSNALKRGPQEMVEIETRASKVRLPLAQVLRIMFGHANGESNRKIAAVEKVSPETVENIVRSDGMREYLQQRYYTIVDRALEAIATSISNGNTELAYKVLQDTGVVPDADEPAQLARQAQSGTRAR